MIDLVETAEPHAAVTRRALVAGGAMAALGLSGSAAWGAVPASGALAFQVLREGKRIGEHRLSFASAGDAVAVTTEVSMTVKLGPVTLFHYAHHAREHWRGGQFESLESHTDSNGRAQRVSARRSAGGVLIESSPGGRVTAPAQAVPLTNWNLDAMRTPLFNPQSGRLLRVTAARGRGTYAGAPATRISIAGEAELTDWYDAAGVWLALRGKLKDGSILEYRRL